MPPISRSPFKGRKQRFAVCHALALERERAGRSSPAPEQPESRATLSLFAPAPPVATASEHALRAGEQDRD